MRTVGSYLFDDNTKYIIDPVTGGSKGAKVCRFDLIPPEALAELSAVYGLGETKYPGDNNGANWEKGYSWRLSFAALCRHLWKWFMGESFDPESSCHHLAHVAWHAFTLMSFEARELGTDNRPKVKVSYENR